MATLQDLRKKKNSHFLEKNWDEQLEIIKEIRALRRTKNPSKAVSKKMDKTILALSQSEIEELKEIVKKGVLSDQTKKE